jgi:hypothetical protein
VSPVLASPERLAEQMHEAYGPFVPGSPARALREEHAAHGLHTCWQCLDGYRPHKGSRPGSLGRGRWFCSWACYRAWLAAHPGAVRHPSRARPTPTPAEILAECREMHRRLAEHVGAGSQTTTARRS